MGFIDSLFSFFSSSSSSSNPIHLEFDLAVKPTSSSPHPSLISPSRPLHLPVELVFNVLEAAYLDDSLNQNDTLLKAAALVCRDWSVPAQKLLFKRVSLQSEHAYTAFSLAVDRSSPRGRMLGDSVQSLHAVLDPNQPNGLSHKSFARAFTLCPRVYDLDVSLYGGAAPGPDVVGSPDASRMQRTASFDNETLSILKSGPQISSLNFHNWSDNQQSLLQLLDLWPSITSLTLSGTPPAIPPSTSLPPPTCTISSLSMNFQSHPSLEFLAWILHNSSSTLHTLQFTREPSQAVLSHLLTFPLHTLSLPSLPRRTSLSSTQTLRELIIESPFSTSILYRPLPCGLRHLALGVNRNTALKPIVEWIKGSNVARAVDLIVWSSEEADELEMEIADVKAVGVYRGIEVGVWRDIKAFRVNMNADVRTNRFIN